MPNARVTLPHDHWVEIRDAWEVTERDVKEMRQSFPKAPNVAKRNLAGTPPQLSAQADDDTDDDDPVKTLKGRLTICWTIRGWGGPLLDGKPVAPESFDDMPIPLSTAIVRASKGFWREVRGEDPTETP